MAVEITMPKLGLTMTSGTIVRWLKTPGDDVAIGDPLLEVSTDKISYEVESPVGGTLARALGNPGDEFVPGAVIGLVAADDEVLTFEGRASPVSALENAAAHAEGSTYEGTIVRSGFDYPPLLPVDRRTIYRRMSQVAEMPLANVETQARVDALKQLIERRGDVGWTAIVVHAVARLLAVFPILRTDARTGAPYPRVDIGVAADTPGGLIVPVVRDADRRSLREMQDEIARLASAAREGRLSGSDVGEAAFTVSNGGSQGVERVVPVVDPPQTAILGMGAAARRPVVVTQPGAQYDTVVPAWTMSLVLTFDHRFVDGAPAGRFLAALAAALSDPGMLL